MKVRHTVVWGIILLAFIWTGSGHWITVVSGLAVASLFVWFMRKEINEVTFRKGSREKKAK